MYPGKEPDYPGLIKQGWIEFTTTDGEQALYHAVANPGGTYVEVVRRHGNCWKAQEFPKSVAENAADKELALLVFENDDIPWGDYQGTLKLGDEMDRRQKYGEPPDTEDIPSLE